MGYFNYRATLNRLDQPHTVDEQIAFDNYTMAAAGTYSSLNYNSGFTGVNVQINITALSGGTPQLYFAIYGVALNYDGTIKYEWPMLTSPIHTATGFQVLKILPGITPIPAGAAADFLPATWKFYMVLSGTGVSSTVDVNQQVIV